MEGDSNTALTRGICPKFWAGPPAWGPPPIKCHALRGAPSPHLLPLQPLLLLTLEMFLPLLALPLGLFACPRLGLFPLGHIWDGRDGWGGDSGDRLSRGLCSTLSRVPRDVLPTRQPLPWALQGWAAPRSCIPLRGDHRKSSLPPSSSCLHPHPAFILWFCLHPTVLPSSPSPAFILIQPSSSSCFHPPTLPPSPSPAFTL